MTNSLATTTPTSSTLRLASSTEEGQLQRWPELAAPQRSIGLLFERLKGQLGSKIDDLYADAKPGLVQREWAQGLFGFTTEEVADGLAACRARKFAPTLGEFLQLCRPSLDPEIAWHEAIEGLAARARGETGQWSHPAVYRAACVMRESLRMGGFKVCRNRWEHVLRTEFAKGHGEPVPPVLVAIIHKPTCSAMPDFVRRKLAENGLTLGRTS